MFDALLLQVLSAVVKSYVMPRDRS